MQITYTCLLPLFVTRFESSQAFFLFGTTVGVPVLFLRSLFPHPNARLAVRAASFCSTSFLSEEVSASFQHLWGSFREIMLLTLLVLFCWRLLLLIFLFHWAAFMGGMFTKASAAVKCLPLEKQFPPDAVGRFHEVRNIACFNIVIRN